MSQDPTQSIDVDYIAGLARLSLTPDEAERFTEEIGAVLDYVNLLSEVDVEGIEPMAHATAIHNVMREDVCGESMARDDMLKNAPAVQHQELIQVPVVIGDDGGGGP